MQPPVVNSFEPARALPNAVEHPYLGALDRYLELRGSNLRPSFWFEPGGDQKTSYAIVAGRAFPFIRREVDGSSVLVGIPAGFDGQIVVTDKHPLSIDWYNPQTGSSAVYVVGSSQLCGASQCLLARARGGLPVQARRRGAQLRQRTQLRPTRAPVQRTAYRVG